MIRDYFPPFVDSNEDLAKLLRKAYLWREQRVPGAPVIINQKVERLKPCQVAEPITKWKMELGWDDQQLCESLDILKNADWIDFRVDSGFLLIELLKIPKQDIGVDLYGVDGTNSGALNLHELFAMYLAFAGKNRKPKTFENAKRVVVHAIRIIPDMKISDLRRANLDRFLEERRTTKVNTIHGPRSIRDATLNMDIRTLKAIMSWAVEMEYIEKNPFVNVKQFRVKAKKTRAFTNDELQSFMQVVNDPSLRGLYVTGFLTGMRRGELVFLKWSNVDFEKMVIHVRSDEDHSTKFDKERDICISSSLKRILKDNPRRSEFVFTDSEGDPFKEDYVTKATKDYIRRAGLDEELHFHSIRATTASVMGSVVSEPFVVKESLGHSHVSVTENYVSPRQEKQRAAMESLAKEILPLIGNRDFHPVGEE